MVNNIGRETHEQEQYYCSVHEKCLNVGKQAQITRK